MPEDMRNSGLPVVQSVVDVPAERMLGGCIPLKFKASLFQKVAAESISTFVLVFAGVGAAMVDSKFPNTVTHLGVCSAFGIAIMVMIYAVGHISGAHMNPAVTVAFAAANQLPWKQVPAYIGGQVTAAITAALALRIIVGSVAHIGVTIPTGTSLQSFALEIIITYILMFVIFSVSTDSRAIGQLGGLAIGATVAGNAIMAGPISGASMNPARSLASAVVATKYTGLWVYILGPTIGAVAGAYSYVLIRLPEPKVENPETKAPDVL